MSTNFSSKKVEIGPLLKSLCDNPSLRVIPRSPPFLVADDEESRTALNIRIARFSDFRSDSDRTIGVQDSDLSRDCGTGMTA